MAAAPLNPLPSPIGIVSSCIATSPTKLIYNPKRKLLDGGHWKFDPVITDTDSSAGLGTKLFRLSPRRRFLLLPFAIDIEDSDGVVLCRLKIDRWHPKQWKIMVYDGTGYKLSGSCDTSKRSRKVEIDLNINNQVGDGKPVIIEIRRFKEAQDSQDHHYSLTVGGKIVAMVSTQPPPTRYNFPSFHLEIAKGFDITPVITAAQILWRYRFPASGSEGGLPPNTMLTASAMAVC